MPKIPPFVITPYLFKLSQDISWHLGSISGAKLGTESIVLRRINNIRTIQASLAIEGNTLDIEQISAIFEGKRVLGPKKDIDEAKNAIEVYRRIAKFNPLSMTDFLKAHKIMMKALVSENGQFRAGNVGIFKGSQVVHMAPPARRVPKLMDDLFDFIKNETTVPWLIKACIFHYELEFIHPFSDGNGRMGRLWQHILLMKENPLFAHIPVETLIKKNQADYYAVLADCDQAGESTKFIEFSLEQILAALKGFQSENARNLVNSPKSRLEYARTKILKKRFSRKDYILLHENISTATASRDLVIGIKMAILEKSGEKNQARYRFLV